MLGVQIRLFDAPAPVESPKEGDRHGLRPYQREAVDAVERELSKVRATLVVAHCGAGKTQIGGALAQEWKGRVLWLAHRDFLVYQARARLTQMTGEIPSVEKAGFRADGSRIVVGSVQTLKGDRLRSWKPDHFSLIIYDEAHHAMAPGGRAILEHLSGAKVFGITATPRRHDKVGAWNCFETEAYRRDIDDGIADGYFVPPVPVARFIDSIDLSKVKTTAGDLNLAGLEAEIAEAAAPIAQATFEEMGDRATIVYTPARSSAHAVAATLNTLKPGSAVSVDMDTPDAERVRILREFGKTIQYICNCAIYTEGLDVPHARGIVIARPTKSEGLYIQMAGRGGRPVPGIGELETRDQRLAAIAASNKPNFILLDITGHAGRHSLVNVTDALAGKVAKDVRDKAKELLKKNEGATLGEVFKLAEKELAEEDRLRRNAVAEAAAAALIKSRRKAFDPFKRLGLTVGPLESGAEPKWTAEPALEDDLTWLRKNRLPTSKATKGTVATLRRRAKEWLRDGRASFRQRDMLSRNGCPPDVSFDKAKQLLDLCYKHGRHGYAGRPPKAEIDRVMTPAEREPGCDDDT
jgi:superfamily II DNA or RNA helicase